MNQDYDVIICGASFAGLSCAKELEGHGLKILVLEKMEQISEKTCASGVTAQDLAFIGDEQMNYPLSPAFLERRDGFRIQMPMGRGMISSISRSKILNHWLNAIASNDITFSFGSKVANVHHNRVDLDNGTSYGYKYLVGADGYFSEVRKYLGLKTERYMLAVQYLVPTDVYKEFVLFEDEGLFGKGYAWIFPNNGFTSIGAAIDCRSVLKTKFNINFKAWLEKKNVSLDSAKFEGFPINYDYRGWDFGKILLVGDAAGFANGLTGKGIYAANLSGTKAAYKILNQSGLNPELEAWLEEKQEDESELELDGNFIDRKINKLLSLPDC